MRFTQCLGSQTPEHFRVMVQSLCWRDRFKLAVHHETKELPVFALVGGEERSQIQRKQSARGRYCGRTLAGI